MNQQVMSHARGWTKRFVSAGVSNHAAISTRGEAFQSIVGVVTIDLVQVPVANIVDVHTPSAADVQLGPATAARVLANGPNLPVVNTFANEAYLGMRDVLRARELLVHNTIPFAAVVGQQMPTATIVGIGSPPANHNAVVTRLNTLPPAVVGAIDFEDHQDYIHLGTNLKWHFMRFTNALSAMPARHAFPLLATQTIHRFATWQQVRPVGMV